MQQMGRAGSVQTTLGARLEACRGIGPGFDHLRVGLALSILTWHAFSISYGQNYAASLPRFPVPVLLGALLPMFFGLSGFLVMGSALRTGELKTFITFRLLRILPALATEVTLSALVLGPLLTALPLRQYFESPMLLAYFGSLIGRVRFSLPGLFLTNPAPELVNFALWTVGPEILCYVLMALFMLTGVYRRRAAMTGVALAYLLVALVAGWLFPARAMGEVLPGKLLIWGFLSGNLLFLYRDRLPFSGALAAASFASAVAVLFMGQREASDLLACLSVPLFVYAVAVVGLSRLPPLPFFRRGDYSYGIYIFGFPIQQAIAYFLPQHREWWVNLAIALPVTLAFAVASWHLIEKPALSLRKRLARREGAPIPAGGRLTLRKWALGLGLCLYGLFVVDAAGVLPLRAGGKMMLYGVGLYQYKPTDTRPFQPA